MAVSAYEVISTQTLGSAAASVTFSSIPQTYTDLVLVAHPLCTAANDYMKVNINSDTGSNYSQTSLYGNGGSALSGRVSNSTFAYLSWLYIGTNPSVIVVNFQNYTNTTTFKTFIFRDSSSTHPGTASVVSLWRSTSAISYLTIARTGGGNFDTGSTFTLYGIKAT